MQEKRILQQLRYAQSNADNLSALRAKYRAIERAWNAAEGQLYLGFLDAMDTYLFQAGLWPEYVEKAKRALPICRKVNNLGLEANIFNNIAVSYCQMGKLQQGLEAFEKALTIRQQENDHEGEIVTLVDVAAIYRRMRQPEQALNYYEQALLVARQVGDRESEAKILTNTALTCHELLDWPRMLEASQQSLSIYRDLGDKKSEVGTLLNMAQVRDIQGNNAEAIMLVEEALRIEVEAGDPDAENTRRLLEELRAKTE